MSLLSLLLRLLICLPAFLSHSSVLLWFSLSPMHYCVTICLNFQILALSQQMFSSFSSHNRTCSRSLIPFLLLFGVSSYFFFSLEFPFLLLFSSYFFFSFPPISSSLFPLQNEYCLSAMNLLSLLLQLPDQVMQGFAERIATGLLLLLKVSNPHNLVLYFPSISIV